MTDKLPSGEAIRAGDAQPLNLEPIRRRLGKYFAPEASDISALLCEVERLRAASDAPERDTRIDPLIFSAREIARHQRSGHGRGGPAVAAVIEALCDRMESLLASPRASAAPNEQANVCWCGHHSSMHPFGHSENLMFDGRCRFCNCKKFVPLSSPSPAPTGEQP